MSDNSTIARPYAKAIFQVALEQNELTAWSDALCLLAEAVLDPVAAAFIQNPVSTLDAQHTLLSAVIEPKCSKKIVATLDNLVKLLAQNKRLLVLPDIYNQFERLRAEHNKTLTVEVKSFSPLSTDQQQALIQRLSQRLKRQVTLDIELDSTLLGGAVVRAGDLVIDGSVRGKLAKLAHTLAA